MKEATKERGGRFRQLTTQIGSLSPLYKQQALNIYVILYLKINFGLPLGTESCRYQPVELHPV